MEPINIAILIGSLLLVISIFTSLLSFRVGAPLLLLFLLLGLVAGEDGPGGIVFDDVPLAYFIGSLALAIILFDSGFQTRLQSWRLAAWPSVTLATIGTVVTAALLSPVAHYALGIGWLEAALISAIVSSTDAAAVFFLLRVGGITIRDKVRSTLEIESGSNDPVAIFLTIGIVEIIRAGGDVAVGQVVLHFFTQMVGGAAFGVLGGFAIVAALNRIRLDAGLYPVAVLSFALLVFAATNVAGGSGFLAVYVAGLISGNARLQGALGLRRFQAGLTWLSQIAMFLTLGLLATPSQFPDIALPALAITAALVFVARPLAVWLCLAPFRYSRHETAFVSWVGLRGAVSILLALVPMLADLEQGRMMFNIAFMVVMMSLLVQGWTIRPMANWLGLLVPRPAVERVEMELPGVPNFELVSYAILDGSPIARGHRIPRWARPVLIRREGTTMTIHNVRQLKPGDKVWLFAAPLQIPTLDKLFRSGGEISKDDPALFGEFEIKPDATLASIAEAYGLPPGGYDSDLTAADLFSRELRDVEVGDRIRVGPVDLIARDVTDGKVTAVGLGLEPSQHQPPPMPLFFHWAEVAAAAKRIFGSKG